jgi:hypothetical protein
MLKRLISSASLVLTLATGAAGADKVFQAKQYFEVKGYNPAPPHLPVRSYCWKFLHVPAGKRLVLEYVSAKIENANSPAKIYQSSLMVYRLDLGQTPPYQEVIHFLDPVRTSASTTSPWILAQPLRLYAETGWDANLCVSKDRDEGELRVHASVSGLLVDAQ